MLNILTTASYFISQNGPQISDIISYLKVYLTEKEMEDFLDCVIAQSYKIYINSKPKAPGGK